MGTAETRLTKHMIADGHALYGERLVIIKHHGSQYSRAGVSDLLGCLDGAFFACEVKAPESYGGSVERALDQGPSVLQQAFIGHVLTAGGWAWVAATREQFLNGLAALDETSRAFCAMCEYPGDYEAGACTTHPPRKPALLA